MSQNPKAPKTDKPEKSKSSDNQNNKSTKPSATPKSERRNSLNFEESSGDNIAEF